jgi:hypothetical protein
LKRGRRAFPILLIAAAVLSQSCAYYSFSPTGGRGGKGGLSTIAIPILVNETLEYGVDRELTDALVEEFTDDNSLRVVPEDQAESVLRGTVVRYERPVISYDAGGSPREYKVRVVARLSYENASTKEAIWEEEIEGWAIYSVTGEGGGVTSEDEARAVAFEKLAQDVLGKTVQGW